MVDIATRVWNHRWKIDPIVRSLIDTDFYKLLMCQSIFRGRPDTVVTFSLINRSKDIRLAELVDEGELREQLDHVRSLSLTRGESTWLRGNTFYGKRQMFRPDFMEWFEGMRLPPYHLEKRDGQYALTFEGKWPEVMLWEIPALAVLMELRSRAVLERMGRFDLEILYARAMTKLWDKITRLKAIDTLRIADFGTRRRHSFLWQDWAVQAMSEGLGAKFTGTSNCLIAQRRDIEAIRLIRRGVRGRVKRTMNDTAKEAAMQLRAPAQLSLLDPERIAATLPLLGHTVSWRFSGIEIAHDRLFAKLHRRMERMNPAWAFVLTMFEALLTLTLVRFVYRSFKRVGRWALGRERKATQVLPEDKPAVGFSGD